MFLRYNYIPAPYSIYKGIKKLTPGNFIKLSIQQNKNLNCSLLNQESYWDLEEIIKDGVKDPYVGSDIDASEYLLGLLRDSVKQQMVADVPIGAFLSGGIDSSLIVSIMQEHSIEKVKTFSIGFNEFGYNEADFAKKVSDHLGTDHTELYISPEKVLDIIPRLPSFYDEPFSDSSQIPTILVSELAKKYVKVFFLVMLGMNYLEGIIGIRIPKNIG